MGEAETNKEIHGCLRQRHTDCQKKKKKYREREITFEKILQTF